MTPSPPPHPIDRDLAIAGWKQVNEATQALESLLRHPPADSSALRRMVKSHIDAGAMIGHLSSGVESVVRRGDEALMAILLGGGSGLKRDNRARLLRECVKQDHMGLVELVATTATSRPDDKGLFEALEMAVDQDHVDAARLILKHGATVDPPDPLNTRSHGRLGWMAKSVGMIDVLMAHGYAPDVQDLCWSALRGGYHGAMPPGYHGNLPRPELLAHLLGKGVLKLPGNNAASDPACKDAFGIKASCASWSSPWEALLAAPAGCVLYPQEHAACARMLLDAGVDISMPAVSLPAMAVLLAAGASSQSVYNAWNQSSDREWAPMTADLFFEASDKRSDDECVRLARALLLEDECVRLARALLLEVDAHGLIMEALLPVRGLGWTHAFAAAGCKLPDYMLATLPTDYRRLRDEALLLRHTPAAKGPSRAARL